MRLMNITNATNWVAPLTTSKEEKVSGRQFFILYLRLLIAILLEEIEIKLFFTLLFRVS